MKRLARIALLSLGLTGLAAPAAGADTLKPNRFGDPEPGKCKPKDCSLREAVIAANKRSGADTIELSKGKYRLMIPEPMTDPNDSSAGDLDLNGETSFVGRGAKKSRVSGEGVSRVLDLQGTLNEYELRDLTVTRGLTDGALATSKRGVTAADGGGILATNLGGSLELRRVIVSKNQAANGGGILFASGDLKIVDSSIRGNDASTYGGGIFLPAGSGLGAAEATVRSSTLSANTAALGGGIALDGFDAGGFPNKPVLDMVNSTVAANAVLVSGGGISAIQGAVVDADQITVARNAADSDGVGGGLGGGIYQSTSANFDIDASILSHNTVAGSETASGAACSGTYTPGVILVDGSGDGCAFTGGIVADLAIGELGNSGGPTQTIPLLEGSPAIDQENSDGCPARDQRGRKRPTEPLECDFGAFERKRRDP